MDRPIVSIIIPCFNYGSFLQQALLSLKNQTFQNWECIIVDDCSSDDSIQIIRDFVSKDSRYSYVQHTENLGVSAARNSALRIARGEFIQLLDADDAIAPDKLSIHVKYLNSNSGIDIVYSDFFHFSNHIDFSSNGEYLKDEKLGGSSSKVLRRLLSGNVFRLNTMLIRRHVFQQGAFNEIFRSVEDWEFWMRSAAKGFFFAYLDNADAKSAVRINPNGLSKDAVVMRRYYLPVLQEIWSLNGLTLSNRNLLWLRYLQVFFDRLFFGKGEIIFTENHKGPFMIRLAVLAIFTWPFFLLYKLIRLIR